MHELSVCQSLLRVIEDHLPSTDCRVTVVRLRIGALSTIVPEAMHAAFPIASESTAAEGAELQISRVPIAVRCEDCGGRTELDAPPIICGFCGSVRVRVEAGDELLIESFDVEEPEV